MSSPEYVVMLTQRCNLRCAYCYQRRSPREQTRDVLEHLARDIRRSGDRRTRVIFHGGEPLLRKDLLEYGASLLVDSRGQRLCDLQIVTNGARIDDDVLGLFRRHRFGVTVSFDGCREAQALRDGRSFDRIVGALCELVPLHGDGEIGLRVALTVSGENLPYLARSVAFLTALGIPRIEIEAELFDRWVEGMESEVERQVEAIVRHMERRHTLGLPVPVARLAPVPDDGDGTWWESPRERGARLRARLDAPECSCGDGSASVILPDGTSWACPMLVPDLGSRSEPWLEARPYGTWRRPGGPSRARVASEGARIRRRTRASPKRERYSRFGACSTCPYALDCRVCPAATHLPGGAKPDREVPPLPCALHRSFSARRGRLRREPRLGDVLAAVPWSTGEDDSAERPPRYEAGG